MQAKRGRPTYNTLIARKLLNRHVPVHLREEEPAAPEEPEATSKGLNALRNVTRILEGKAPRPDPLPMPEIKGGECPDQAQMLRGFLIQEGLRAPRRVPAC